MVEVKTRYDNAPFGSAREVNMSVHVKRAMHAPIYVYYELDNFHQVRTSSLLHYTHLLYL
jgi:hypothetical protein